jgi:hypothetical protein
MYCAKVAPRGVVERFDTARGSVSRSSGAMSSARDSV